MSATPASSSSSLLGSRTAPDEAFAAREARLDQSAHPGSALGDALDVPVGGALAALARDADEDAVQVRVVVVGFDGEVWASADDVPEKDESLEQERCGVGLGVGFDGAHEATQKAGGRRPRTIAQAIRLRNPREKGGKE